MNSLSFKELSQVVFHGSLLCVSKTLYTFSVNFRSVCFLHFHLNLSPEFDSALSSMEKSIILMNCKVSRMVPLSKTEKREHHFQQNICQLPVLAPTSQPLREPQSCKCPYLPGSTDRKRHSPEISMEFLGITFLLSPTAPDNSLPEV